MNLLDIVHFYSRYDLELVRRPEGMIARRVSERDLTLDAPP